MKALFSRSMALRAGLLTLSLLMMSGPAVANTGVICGKPKKSGNVTMNVVVKRGVETRVVAVTLAVDVSWTAEYKANLFWAAFAVTKADTVLPAQSIERIEMAGQNGWTVTGVGIANDESLEPDDTFSAAPFADQVALCSLSGTASGLAADGSPGSFRVTISGRTVTLPTFPGMPASILEQQLIGQLNGMGVQSRFATAADFADGLEALPHDASVVWMQPSDSTGFQEELNDTGLLMQLAMLLDTGPVVPVGVSERPTAGGIELSAHPMVFSSGSVQLRYSLDRASRLGEISVFDAGGRRVRRLGVGDGTAGAASGVLRWDGRGQDGGEIPSGVYFVRLTSGPVAAMTRVVRLK